MVTCDLIRGGVMLSLPWAHTIWQLVSASLLLEVATLLWSPAKEASVPNLVPAEHLTTVNSLSLAAAYGTFPPAAILFSSSRRAGPMRQGLRLFHFLDSLNNESLALYFDALTFVMSAVMISMLPLVHRRRSQEARRAHAEEAKATRSCARSDGWHFIYLTLIVRGVMVAIGCGFVGGGMLVLLGPLFARDVLNGGDATFGSMLTVLGGPGHRRHCAVRAEKRLPKAKIFTLAVFGVGVSLVAAAAMSSSCVVSCSCWASVCAPARAHASLSASPSCTNRSTTSSAGVCSRRSTRSCACACSSRMRARAVPVEGARLALQPSDRS